MRMLVGQAWLVTDQAAIGGPKSLDGPKYDLIAKIPWPDTRLWSE